MDILQVYFDFRVTSLLLSSSGNSFQKFDLLNTATWVAQSLKSMGKPSPPPRHGKQLKAMSMYATLQLPHQSYAHRTCKFPPSSIVDKDILVESSLTTSCPWKGVASYYSLNVDGKTLKDAAWYYPTPKSGAANIKDHVAFCESRMAARRYKDTY